MRIALFLILIAEVTQGYYENSKKKKVLSFGGNGMIGSAVLHQMIKTKEYDITLVSRGNWHYDSRVRIKPHVEAVVCDRNQVPTCDNCSINALDHCQDLVRVVSEAKHGFDVVLDFSAYEPKWVHDAIDMLKGKHVGVYVYISSDAVYEVSAPKSTKRLSKEEDAQRPSDPKLKHRLRQQDPYGHAKLGGEEALVDQRGKGGFPWVAFRYADVIGPRDVTRRFAFYHTWLKFYSDIGIPFFLPKKFDAVEESITFVEDAAYMVMRAIEKGDGVWDNAYNVASAAVVTLEQIIKKMAHHMNVTITDTNKDNSNLHMYPTVFSGGIDISKAEKLLDFHPTDLDEALSKTIKWYDNEFAHNYDYREEMISDIMARLVPKEKRSELYLAIDRELTKVGIKDPNYRGKRKGDIEVLEKFERDPELLKIKKQEL